VVGFWAEVAGVRVVLLGRVEEVAGVGAVLLGRAEEVAGVRVTPLSRAIAFKSPIHRGVPTLSVLTSVIGWQRPMLRQGSMFLSRPVAGEMSALPAQSVRHTEAAPVRLR
jgi:hypothetical protein